MAFVSHQMSAPLQRRALSRLSPHHAARIAETLHHLRRCRALASGKRITKPRARRKGAQCTQVNGGYLGEEILCILVSPAFTGSGCMPLFLNPQELGDRESGSSGNSVLIWWFYLTKNKSKHICFTEGDLILPWGAWTPHTSLLR